MRESICGNRCEFEWWNCLHTTFATCGLVIDFGVCSVFCLLFWLVFCLVFCFCFLLGFCFVFVARFRKICAKVVFRPSFSYFYDKHKRRLRTDDHGYVSNWFGGLDVCSKDAV